MLLSASNDAVRAAHPTRFRAAGDPSLWLGAIPIPFSMRCLGRNCFPGMIRFLDKPREAAFRSDMQILKRLTAGLLVAWFCLAATMTRADNGPAGRITYPEAKRGDVVDDFFGVEVADPYRWLEELDSP